MTKGPSRGVGGSDFLYEATQPRHLATNDLGTVSLEGLRHHATLNAAVRVGWRGTAADGEQQGSERKSTRSSEIFRSKRRCPPRAAPGK